ncbi:MAG TPA: ribonuclease J [Dehalococcoidales bacterium]|nr:ribonuclease J [Dehalococcoidales bacterium]
MSKSKLRIIPLGGLNEIGKNMMILEYEDDIIIIDCGLMFPGEDMLGVDMVIPDISYLADKKDKIRAMVITHGHEDHIGALPFILNQIGGNIPIYATRLTQGLISVKLKEGKIPGSTCQKTIIPGVQVSLGKFKIEFFHVCHSIPDAAGIIVYTPVGTVVHSGDFKLDYTPVDGKPTDLSRLSQLGTQGVLLLMADSTYAELPGYTPSERVVGETFERIMSNAQGRVIVTTFASLISRIQQVIDAAVKYGRRCFIVGRSMNENIKMAVELGYLNAPDNVLGKLEEARGLPPNKVVFITTGSQGEPTSALVRMANQNHSQVHVQKGDTVILSATPIPGNEALVNRTVDTLFKRGAHVIYDRLAQVHVHGHASQEELKLLLNLVKPRFFMPLHGEYRHLTLHAKLGEAVGIPKSNILLLEDGHILEINATSARIAGKTSAGHVYVDGLSVGDVDNSVLHDRRVISRDGIAMVVIAVYKETGILAGRPELVSRGFVDTREAQELIEQSKDYLVQILNHEKQLLEWSVVSMMVKDNLSNFFYEKVRRKPVIIPVLIKV